MASSADDQEIQQALPPNEEASSINRTGRVSHWGLVETLVQAADSLRNSMTGDERSRASRVAQRAQERAPLRAASCADNANPRNAAQISFVRIGEASSSAWNLGSGSAASLLSRIIRLQEGQGSPNGQGSFFDNAGLIRLREAVMSVTNLPRSSLAAARGRPPNERENFTDRDRTNLSRMEDSLLQTVNMMRDSLAEISEPLALEMSPVDCACQTSQWELVTQLKDFLEARTETRAQRTGQEASQAFIDASSQARLEQLSAAIARNNLSEEYRRNYSGSTGQAPSGETNATGPSGEASPAARPTPFSDLIASYVEDLQLSEQRAEQRNMRASTSAAAQQSAGGNLTDEERRAQESHQWFLSNVRLLKAGQKIVEALERWPSLSHDQSSACVRPAIMHVFRLFSLSSFDLTALVRSAQEMADRDEEQLRRRQRREHEQRHRTGLQALNCIAHFFEQQIRFHLMTCAQCCHPFALCVLTPDDVRLMEPSVKKSYNAALATLITYRALSQHRQSCQPCTSRFSQSTNQMLTGNLGPMQPVASCSWTGRPPELQHSCALVFLKFTLEEHLRGCEVCGSYFPKVLPPPGSANQEPAVMTTTILHGFLSADQIYEIVDFLMYRIRPMAALTSLAADARNMVLYPAPVSLTLDEAISLLIGLLRTTDPVQSFFTHAHDTEILRYRSLPPHQSPLGDAILGRQRVFLSLDPQAFVRLRLIVKGTDPTRDEQQFLRRPSYMQQMRHIFSFGPSWPSDLATDVRPPQLISRVPSDVIQCDAVALIFQRVSMALCLFGETLRPPPRNSVSRRRRNLRGLPQLRETIKDRLRLWKFSDEQWRRALLLLHQNNVADVRMALHRIVEDDFEVMRCRVFDQFKKLEKERPASLRRSRVAPHVAQLKSLIEEMSLWHVHIIQSVHALPTPGLYLQETAAIRRPGLRAMLMDEHRFDVLFREARALSLRGAQLLDAITAERSARREAGAPSAEAVVCFSCGRITPQIEQWLQHDVRNQRGRFTFCHCGLQG